LDIEGQRLSPARKFSGVCRKPDLTGEWRVSSEARLLTALYSAAMNSSDAAQKGFMSVGFNNCWILTMAMKLMLKVIFDSG